MKDKQDKPFNLEGLQTISIARGNLLHKYLRDLQLQQHVLAYWSPLQITYTPQVCFSLTDSNVKVIVKPHWDHYDAFDTIFRTEDHISRRLEHQDIPADAKQWPWKEIKALSTMTQKTAAERDGRGQVRGWGDRSGLSGRRWAVETEKKRVGV